MESVRFLNKGYNANERANFSGWWLEQINIFGQQIKYYKNALITVAYEHYPKIPYYFSNRLPIALLSGSIYVCHYHAGYEKIFNEGDFIFFFRTNQEAIDIIKYITSLNTENLIERSKRARLFALANYTPEVVWKNFYDNILKNG